MGAGSKMDPTRFEVTDIYKTSVCPLAGDCAPSAASGGSST